MTAFSFLAIMFLNPVILHLDDQYGNRQELR
ncbi:hypothetical protein OMCYN_01250 [cyanobiont of Ornithocercus magnificus]|nr:hypothetical protein OMCYN_01250 [cyanobiont of Ornithocercus magnificus]